MSPSPEDVSDMSPVAAPPDLRADVAPWTIRGIGLAFGVVIVVTAATVVIAAGSVLLLLFLAILFASALEPIVGIVRSRAGIGRGATILLVYAVFFAVVLAFAFLVVPGAISQAERIATSLPPLLADARTWAAGLRPTALSTSITALIDSAAAIVTPAPPGPDVVVKAGFTVAEVAVSVATVLALVYFWLVEHARLQRYLLAFVPAERRAGTRDAWNEIETRLGLWVRGELTLMATMGAATGLAYTALGVPSALLLALVAALTEAIPIVGPFLGAIPAILVAATVSPQLALIVAGIYVVLQILEGNVLVPTVMRNTVGISPLLVLLSLLVGAAVGGLVGAFLAVPVVASIEIAIAHLQAREVPVAQDPSTTEGPEEPDVGDTHKAPDSAAVTGAD
jgi:predicted PurR-regulated permease PerM